MADESFDELDVLKLATLNLSIQISTELAGSLRNSDIDSSATSKLASLCVLGGALYPFGNETNVNYTQQSTEGKSVLRFTLFYI